MKAMIRRYVSFYKMNKNLLKIIARSLRISSKELVLLRPEIYPDLARDKSVLSYSVYFRKNAPARILKKIRGIDFDNSVTLSPAQLTSRTTRLAENAFTNLKL